MSPPSPLVNPLSTCLHSPTPLTFLSILVHHQHNQILQDLEQLLQRFLGINLFIYIFKFLMPVYVSFDVAYNI